MLSSLFNVNYYDYSTEKSNHFELSMLNKTENDLDEIPIYYRNATRYYIDDNEIIYAKSLCKSTGYFIPDSKMLKNLYKKLDIPLSDKKIWEKVTGLLKRVEGSFVEIILQTRFEKELLETDKSKCLKIIMENVLQVGYSLQKVDK